MLRCQGRRTRLSRQGLVLLPSEPTLLLLSLLVEGAGRAIRAPCLLRASLLALLDVPPTGAAAALAQGDQECKDRCHRCYPHEHEHLRADLSFDVQLLDGCDGSLHDDEHHCCDDRGHRGEEGGQEGEDCDEKADPAGVDCDELHRDHDCGKAGAGEEEGEHPVGDEADQVEDLGHVGREGN